MSSRAIRTPDNTFDKDPGDNLDFGIRWGDNWLGASETISTSTWDVPDGLTEGLSGLANSNKTAFVWLSGGTPKRIYPVTNTIVTNENRTANRTIFVRVTEL